MQQIAELYKLHGPQSLLHMQRPFALFLWCILVCGTSVNGKCFCHTNETLRTPCNLLRGHHLTYFVNPMQLTSRTTCNLLCRYHVTFTIFCAHCTRHTKKLFYFLHLYHAVCVNALIFIMLFHYVVAVHTP